MANERKYKTNLIKIKEVFERYTDSEHALSIAQIGQMAVDVGDEPINRKTLYRSFDELRDYGIDIKCLQKGRTYLYYVDYNYIKTEELVFLIEQTEEKFGYAESLNLKKKLFSLVSIYQEKEVNRMLRYNKKIRKLQALEKVQENEEQP